MHKGFLAIVALSAAMWMHSAMAQDAGQTQLGPKIAEACGWPQEVRRFKPRLGPRP